MGFNMKRFSKILALVFMLSLGIFFFAGCGETQSDSITVYTSFYPIYDLTKKIAGDKIEITNLIPSGAEPHDYEPSSKDMAALQSSDVFFINGLGMEHWVNDIAETLSNTQVVDLSAGIDTIVIGENTDPHIWLSLKNAKIMLGTIKDTLALIDSANATYYTNNYNKYMVLFTALDNEFARVTSEFESTTVVVLHKAYAYLCRDYDLTQYAILGLSPDSEPDASKMAEIINFVQANDISTIFYEELVSPNISIAIANATGASVDILYTIEGLNDEQVGDGDDFLTIMAKNLIALEKALGQ